jgi:AraC-like DNA-binding protein
MIYEEIPAPAAQSAAIACYWQFVVEPSDAIPFEHTIMPDGTVSLFHFRGTSPQDWCVAIAGPGVEARKVMVRAPGRWLGIRFRAGVAGAVLGIKAAELRDCTKMLDSHGDLAANVHLALTDAASIGESVQRLSVCMEHWIIESRPIDAEVVTIAAAISESGGQIAIADLCRSSGLSIRQLRRRFVAQVGLTLKEYSRARRVRRAFVDALGDIKSRWVEISIAAGYADQAHLIRD